MYRILVGALLPIIFMSLFTAYLQIISPKDQSWVLAHPTMWDYIFDLVKNFFVGFALIAAVAGIPSLLSSILMEKIINPTFHNHIAVIVIATILGVISGVFISFIIRGITELPFHGAIIGALTGIILRYLYIRAQK